MYSETISPVYYVRWQLEFASYFQYTIKKYILYMTYKKKGCFNDTLIQMFCENESGRNLTKKAVDILVDLFNRLL